MQTLGDSKGGRVVGAGGRESGGEAEVGKGSRGEICKDARGKVA